MIDYRQESLENARGAIKGVFLLNGGAAVALLTQISTLKPEIAGAVLFDMEWWSAGQYGAGSDTPEARGLAKVDAASDPTHPLVFPKKSGVVPGPK